MARPKPEINETRPKKLPGKPSLVSRPRETILYDKSGNECSVLPEDQIMACHIAHHDKDFYKVRVNRRQELYDPYKKSYADDSYAFARAESMPPFSMITVDKTCFEHYVDYLKNKKYTMLRMAQGKI